MKKVLSIFLAVVILISGVVFASAKGNDKLQFDENGQFKILVLADIQSGFPVGEALKAYITEAIEGLRRGIPDSRKQGRSVHFRIRQPR